MKLPASCVNKRHYCDYCDKHMRDEYLILQNRRIGRNIAFPAGRFCNEKCLAAQLKRERPLARVAAHRQHLGAR